MSTRIDIVSQTDSTQSHSALPQDTLTVGNLIEALSSTDVSVRCDAIKALGRTKDPSVIPALLKMVNDPNISVVYETMDALEEIGGDSLIHEFSSLMYRPHISLEDPEYASKYVTSCGIARYALRALIRIGEPAVPYLLQALDYTQESYESDQFFGEEDLIVQTLMDIRCESAISVLIRRTEHCCITDIQRWQCIDAIIEIASVHSSVQAREFISNLKQMSRNNFNLFQKMRYRAAIKDLDYYTKSVSDLPLIADNNTQSNLPLPSDKP